MPPFRDLRDTPELSDSLAQPGALATINSIPGLSVVPATGASGFNALSHQDERLAYSGNQFSIEPPSASVAVGNGFILEGVNDAIRVFTTAGIPAMPVVASNQLFGLPPAIDRTTGVNGVYLTDMRVFFDNLINRWFVVQRSQDNDALGNALAASHLYVAVSQSADPTGNYNIYVMDTTNATHTRCPCVADYPQIGADQFGFHIAWNEYSASSLSFVDAAILSVSKPDLASGIGSPSAFQFLVPFNNGFEFSLQPATAPPGAANFVGNGGLEYLVSTFSSSTEGSGVALWALTSTNSLLTATPNLGLTEVVVPTLTYTFPNAASQPKGATPLGTSLGEGLEHLDGGDVRVQALSYASARLYMTFPTGVIDETGHLVIGGAYVVLSPTYRGGVLAAQVVSQGYLVVDNNHLLRPAIAVNAQGNGAIAVTLVGSAGNYYPSAALIPFSTFSTPSTVQVVAPGALPEDGFTGYAAYGGQSVARWGDYNTAVAASDGSIWAAVQFIGNYSRTPLANWNTFIIHNQP